MLVGIAVAIGDPLLAIGADAGKIVVLTTAPDRVGVAEPEGRWIRARREVHVEIRLLGAELLDEMDCRVEVAVERAPRKRARRVAGAVELELVDAVLADHPEARVTKARVVSGP